MNDDRRHGQRAGIPTEDATKPDDAIIRRFEQAVDHLGCSHMKPYARWRLGYGQDRPNEEDRT